MERVRLRGAFVDRRHDPAIEQDVLGVDVNGLLAGVGPNRRIRLRLEAPLFEHLDHRLAGGDLGVDPLVAALAEAVPTEHPLDGVARRVDLAALAASQAMFRALEVRPTVLTDVARAALDLVEGFELRFTTGTDVLLGTDLELLARGDVATGQVFEQFGLDGVRRATAAAGRGVLHPFGVTAGTDVHLLDERLLQDLTLG